MERHGFVAVDRARPSRNVLCVCWYSVRHCMLCFARVVAARIPHAKEEVKNFSSFYGSVVPKSTTEMRDLFGLPTPLPCARHSSVGRRRTSRGEGWQHVGRRTLRAAYLQRQFGGAFMFRCVCAPLDTTMSSPE